MQDPALESLRGEQVLSEYNDLTLAKVLFRSCLPIT